MSDVNGDAKAIFFEAIDCKEPDELLFFLEQSCGSDRALRARVEELLRAHRDAGAFLGGSANLETANDRSISERPGTIIGPYKLMEQIGEGGMGLVFVAEQQQPVRRKVAVKVIKPGMDTREVIARFEAERQALALMDHPNIARVLDAGATESGRPYFVMELVRGFDITQYCDENRLTPRERLGLFVHVCQAVQHAHQKGIIHRDLKATNILVTLHDGQPVVKVIDFGVAKAIGQQLTDKTIYTRFTQLIGTPMYMSPEQAEMSGLDIDTRSDIYALGVLLYELLTGETPFDKERLKTASYDEIRRIVREEEPPRPSQRVSTLLAETLTVVSAQRNTDPKHLPQLFRGELDWIVMKALEKDRNRRYETASAFAADVQRYLQDEPVQACPPSTWYRFGKFARRHKAILATSVLIALTVLAAFVGLTISNVRIAEEKTQKELALAEAEHNLMLARQAVDEIYTPVAHQLSQVPHMQPFQRDVILKADGFYKEFAKRKSNDPAIQLEAFSATLFVIQIQAMLGKRGNHEQDCRAVIASVQKLELEKRLEHRRNMVLADALVTLAHLLSQTGRTQEATSSLRKGLALYIDLVKLHPDDPRFQRRLASAHNTLASLHLEEAEQNSRKAIGLCEALVKRWPDEPYNHGELFHSHYVLGNNLYRMGRLPDADKSLSRATELYEKERAKLDRTGYRATLPTMYFAHGVVLEKLGQTKDAAAALRKSVILWEKSVDQFPDIPNYQHALSQSYFVLIKILGRTNQRDEAAKFANLAVELTMRLQTDLADESQPRTQLIRNLQGYGANLRDAREFPNAVIFFSKALDLAKKQLDDNSNDAANLYLVAESYGGLGSVFQRSRRYQEGADAYRKYLDIVETLTEMHPDDPDYRFYLASGHNFVGVALRYLPEEKKKVVFHHRRALELLDPILKIHPNDSRSQKELVRTHYALGIAHNQFGQWAQAKESYQHAVSASAPLPVQTVDPIPQIHNNLAWLLCTCPDVTLRDAKRAVDLACKAVELAPDNANHRNTLGVAYYRAGKYQEALVSLNQSIQRESGGDSFDWFFLAMAHWKLDEKDKAIEWHDRAVKWMAKHRPKNEELRSFRAEAEELLGLTQKKD